MALFCFPYFHDFQPSIYNGYTSDILAPEKNYEKTLPPEFRTVGTI